MRKRTNNRVVDGVQICQAPFDEEEVANLRAWQASGHVHEFTGKDRRPLIPTTAGWVAEEDGPVVQTWAHDFMLDGSALKEREELLGSLSRTGAKPTDG